MTRPFALALAALAAVTLLAAEVADAKRLGGGRSLGAQRPVAPPAAAPAAPAAPAGATVAPAMPAKPGAAADPVMKAQPGAPAAKAAAAPAAKPASAVPRWLGPVAAIAAGLGLAALAAHLGISETLMSLLLLAAMIMGVILVVRLVLARRMAARTGGLQYAGGAAAASSGTFGNAEMQPPAPPAAAPTPLAERIEPTLEPMTGAGTAKVPPGFAVEPFVEEARRQFHRLQAAFDQDDRVAMARLMTPELFAEVVADRASRTAQFSTEIVALNAELLEVVTEGDRHWASVRYRGVLREDHATLPRPFDEIWNLTKPVNGSMGWLLAGIQQVEPGAPAPAEGVSA